MNLDIHTSYHTDAHHQTAKRTLLGRSKKSSVPIQGAVRINPQPARLKKNEYPLRRTAIFAAFFVFSGLVATISNGNTDDLNMSRSPAAMIEKAVVKNGSLSDPDFYFIDANQFVPGSVRLQTAAYTPTLKKNSVVQPEKKIDSLPDLPMESELNSITPLTEISPPEQTPKPEFFDKQVVVKSGDTLSELALANGIQPSELHLFLTHKLVKKHLKTLRINQSLDFRQNADGHFSSISVKLGREQKLVVSKSNSGFNGAVIDMPLRREIQTSSARIDSSLFLAGQAAGLSQKTIMNLVDIFQWDVDFGLDIRKGDTFKVVYEKLFRDGQFLGDGDILAAEFINAGRSVRAIRYTDLDGRTSYYAPDGRSMRKAFLRNPVDVVRITSHFNPNRKHPVLHTIRAHKGTDYGAPIGTPIRSSGDGKLIFAGVKGGYGNTIVIKHGDKITTLYAHMSKFAKGMKSGKRVKQGQIIGYVGKSGRVTGAHLHYEFRINGEHKNPLKVKLPGAQPLPKKFKADFNNKSRHLLVTLDRLNTEKVALGSR